ncbi:MAG: RIP metalloprotease RseP [Patescibacteria group bacterium]|jgi:regulator of sigma E protease
MFLTVITFFAVLGVLVIAHELGHFFAARRGGVRVDEFGFGLPPRVFGVKVLAGEKLEKIAQTEDISIDIEKSDSVIKEVITDKVTEIDRVKKIKKWQFVWGNQAEPKNDSDLKPGTIYSLNWIPLGGFVKIKGEEGQSATDEDSFAHKGVWRRIWIVSAGVLMNLILAAVLLTIIFAVGSPQFIDQKKISNLARVSDVKIRVVEVLPDSPAAKADLKVSDTILTIDGQTFVKIDELQNYINGKINQPIKLEVQRESEFLTKEITPQVLTETQKGGMGVALVQTAFVSYPWYIAWWYGITETLTMVWGVISGFYLIIKNLLFSHQMIGDVYGPIGIATLVGDAARMGFLYLVQFTAVLSIIIAVINFLPFPALDGGRVLFLLIEAVRGRPVNQKFENALHNLGFALLMILFVVVTFRDIARLSSGFLTWWQNLTRLF